MKPLYEPGARAHAVLRFGWAGWPTSHTVFPRVMESCLTMPSAAWEGDGMRLFEYEFGPKRVLMTFGVTPQVAPVLFTARAKGRLDYALRVAKVGVSFSRKVAMCSLGENHRVEVESYIQNQVDKEPLADPAARETLRQFTVVDPEVDLSQPTATKSGRYWYNLHLVLVTEGRWRTCDPRWLGKIRDQAFRIAEKKGYRISRLSAMPDHLHLSLRGNPDDSPETIALAFQNNLAYALGQFRVWRPTYHAGTFGEYDMNAVRTWD